MSAPRTYGDPCGVARSLDVVGERWALLVVRELLLGPKRFSDLLAGLAGASPNVVSQRLRDLVRHGVVHRRDLGPPTRVHLYELTPWGRALEPVVLHLGRWGSQAPHDPGGPLGVDSLVLGLKATFAAGPARGGGRATCALRIDDHDFTLVVDDGALDARRGAAERPDVAVATTAGALAAAVRGERTLDDLVAAGALTITGDDAAVALVTASVLAPATTPP